LLVVCNGPSVAILIAEVLP